MDPADTADGGWRYLDFTPSGVLEWSWSVPPRSPVSQQQLRLELRPAARSSERILGHYRTSTADYVTTVNVSATFIDRLAYWFKTQWEPLTVVAGSIAAAILAILAFSSKARDGAKGLFTKQSPKTKQPPKRGARKAATTASTSTKRPRTKTKQTNKPGPQTKQTDKRSQRTDGGEK